MDNLFENKTKIGAKIGNRIIHEVYIGDILVETDDLFVQKINDDDSVILYSPKYDLPFYCSYWEILNNTIIDKNVFNYMAELFESSQNDGVINESSQM